MKTFFLFLSITLLSLCSLAAQSHPVAAFSIDGPEDVELIRLEAPTGSFWAFHLESSAGIWPEGGAFRLSSPENDRVGEWQPIHQFHHNPEAGISELLYTEAEAAILEFRLPAGDYEVYAYDPGPSATEMTPTPEAANAACPCAQPLTVNRSNWCPAGNCSSGSSPALTTVTHLIVHHSAGSNSSSDWAAVVRSIWNFHVNTNGWDDIGYNYLVDPNGIVYVGRGDNIRGAHFCGNNTGTMGVCVMGDFTNIAPTQNALGSLALMLAWKACGRNLDPLTSSLHASSSLNLSHVAGHRQGCATSCPGDSFFPLFPTLRQSVADVIANCIVSGTSGAVTPAVDITVAPNPSWGQVSLRGEAAIESVTVFSSLGQQLWSKDYLDQTMEVELDLAVFGPGEVLLLIETTKGRLGKWVSLN